MANSPLETLQAKILSDANALKLNPGNTALRLTILRDQVVATSTQLGISNREGGQVVKAYTAAYAKTKGIDPQQLLDSLTKDEQALLDYSANNPTIFGVSLITANKIAGYLAVGQTVFFGAFLVASAIALFTVGPEALAAVAGAEGFFQALSAVAKVPSIRNAAILFGIAEILGALSTRIPMITKQLIDNGSIGPGLRIDAIKSAEEEKAKLSGTASPGSFTGSQFSDYAQSLEVNGITAINNPCQAAQVPYSRTALAELVKCVYGKAVTTGAGSTVTKLIPQLAPYLVMKGLPASNISYAPAKGSAASSSAPTTKVFTGIVSSGVVGNGLTFTPRPDDLIENIGELQHAVSNNVSTYLAALLGKVTYEIKIVSSVIVGGIKRTGASVQVQSGVSKAGKPLFRTVTNKFAVADLYITTDKGTRSKLTSIVLGPTDAIKFNPSAGDLTTLAISAAQDLVTTNTDDISQVVTGTPTLVVPPGNATSPDGEPSIGYTFVYDGYKGAVSFNTKTVNRLRREVASGLKSLDNAVQELLAATAEGEDKWTNQNPNVVRVGFTLAPQLYRNLLSTGGTFAGTPQEVSAGMSPPQVNTTTAASQTKEAQDRFEVIYDPGSNRWSVDDKLTKQTSYFAARADAFKFAGQVDPGSSAATSLPAAALSAQTLFDFFAAQGKALPSLSARADLYQSLGIGQAAFYTGTAEQNTKLLSRLKTV